jgi:hypothetical protein
MPGPRRKHSTPHIPSVRTLDSIHESIDLSPTPEIDELPTLAVPVIDKTTYDNSLIDYKSAPADLPASDMPEIDSDPILLPPDSPDSAGYFAMDSPAFQLETTKPEPGHKFIPVLSNTRRIQVPKRIDALEEEFIRSLGSREELQKALATCEQLHIQRFLNDLTNLKHRDKGIAFLARKHAITPLELADIWRRHCLAQGMLNLIAGLPQMAADIVEDARSRMVPCERCDGLGEVEYVFGPKKGEIRVCPQCEGSGKVRIAGSSDARKMALEATGLVGKRATLIQSATIHAHNVESVIGELENLQIEAGSGSNKSPKHSKLNIER